MITPPNIIFVLGLLGVVFSVYRYFKEPQEKSDRLVVGEIEKTAQYNDKKDDGPQTAHIKRTDLFGPLGITIQNQGGQTDNETGQKPHGIHLRQGPLLPLRHQNDQ